ncbi:hypothetical protein DXT99_23305 [Pontibacter diazotrophicus]|uniref:Uncharacterized protein n=1 Tax=Pontibacter diazotrophicus TaxID=1400979 RepID=A0A3D8L3S0_9BACT|nr:hypothetical protein [Pontibacter diazotrophicus]RDV11953.1 hypothetical protein DXT99_23305 [Pontibacter diazotrophicus]
MEKFKGRIAPLLESDEIRYQASGVVKSMSVDYFSSNFREITVTELPNIGLSSYYYQSIENPDLVMHFRISETAGLSATLMLCRDFESKLKETGI